MLDTREIHPLTDFLRTHIARLKETQSAEVLTVNGHAQAVQMDAVSYQNLLERVHQVETLTTIREGISVPLARSGLAFRL
jgi:hypothetical protein